MVYNPGGQRGKSIRGSGQRPAKDPKGPFLGKSASSSKGSQGNPNPRRSASGQTGTRGGKGKHDASQNRSG
jgi:hypothetical protein